MSFQLEKYIKEIFEEESSKSDRLLEEDELKHILQCEKNAKDLLRKSIVGYPGNPLYKEVSNVLQKWMEEGTCPINDMIKYKLLDEQSYAESREATFATITPLLTGLETLSSLWSPEEIKFRIREVLLLLGKRGILDLLGIRKTVGTVDMLPPSRKKLMQSFTEKNSPNSDLSVGARALAKHFHRDNTSAFWGDSTGTEKQKNEHAHNLVTQILDNATWINIHWLPHDVYVIEAREYQGYGARWTADGTSFRGFLEPQMIDGHSVGWKH